MARASLQRATVARNIDTLRDSLRWPRAAASLGASPLARSIVFGGLVLLVRHGRVARLLGLAAGALGAVKLALALARPKGERLAAQEPTSEEVPT